MGTTITFRSFLTDIQITASHLAPSQTNDAK